MNCTAKLQVKQTLLNKTILKLVLIMGSIKLMTFERAIQVSNWTIKRGFKYRMNKGRWRALDTSNYTLEVSD